MDLPLQTSKEGGIGLKPRKCYPLKVDPLYEVNWGDGSHTHFHGSTRCLICGMQMELPSSFVLNGVTCTDCRLRQKRVVEEWESENELPDPNQ